MMPKIFIIAGLGTTLMTLFSYGMAVTLREEYSESFLLNKFLSRKFSLSAESHRAPLGWLIHFAVGVLFVLLYHALWTKGLAQTLINDLLLGFLSGIIGAAGWLLVRAVDQGMKELWIRSYYFQLIVAHVVFAITASTLYRFLE